MLQTGESLLLKGHQRVSFFVGGNKVRFGLERRLVGVSFLKKAEQKPLYYYISGNICYFTNDDIRVWPTAGVRTVTQRAQATLGAQGELMLQTGESLLLKGHQRVSFFNV